MMLLYSNTYSEISSNSWVISLFVITTALPVCSKGIEEVPIVRLVNGTTSSEGRLEVLYNSTWGTVCDDFFSTNNGEVVCRQLNYVGVKSVIPMFGGGEGPIWLDDVDCTGSEDSIFDCNHTGFGEHNCGHAEDVGIVCDLNDNVEEGAIRLSDGNRFSNGRVEIFHDGEWGTVCDRGWDIDDATVVCRQLGFERALSAPLRSEYGPGLGTIWLSNVRCTGSELKLTECDHDGWEQTRWCFHRINDASVECEGGATSMQSPTTTPSLVTTTDEIDAIASAKATSHTELPPTTESDAVPHSNHTNHPISIPTAQSLELILGLVALGLLLLGSAVLLLIIILVCICRNRQCHKSVRVEDQQQDVFPAIVNGLEDQSNVVYTHKRQRTAADI